MAVYEIVQVIGDIPAAGVRGADSRDDFVLKQQAFQDQLTTYTVDQMNLFGDQANALAVYVNSQADAAIAAETAVSEYYTKLDVIDEHMDSIDVVGVDLLGDNYITAVGEQILNNNLQTVASDIAAVIEVSTDLKEAVSEIESVAADLQGDGHIDIVGADLNLGVDHSLIYKVATEVAPNMAEILTADDNAILASNAKNDAVIARDQAQSIIDNIAVAPVWISGENYPQFGINTDPVNFKTYKAVNAISNSTVAPRDSGDWADISSGESSTLTDVEFTAYADQTDFAVTYVPSRVMVYRNGKKLASEDFEDHTGDTIKLTTPARVNDIIVVTVFGVFVVADTYTISEIDALITASVQTFITRNAAYTTGAGEFVYVDTSAGGFTITLPASPNNNDRIDLFDVTESFNTNNLIVARNGNTIMGLAEDMNVSTSGAFVQLIYINTDWRLL